ncbi:MAG: hypothetical protein H0T79_05270 [Deltaproteobacteria bacterium]|nr:hypothetical protein [Deltaproteobacteria bacterium]
MPPLTSRAHLARLALAALGACGAPSSTQLDASTLPDGVATQPDAHDDAAPPTGRDPAGDGDFVVTTQVVAIPIGTRSAAATTFVPAAAPAPRPLVVISPGFQMPRTQYVSYAQHLASWGMTVVLADYADTSFFPDHQGLADDVRGVITWALAQPGLGADATKIATAGHSLGGKISTLAAADDTRIVAVIGWDPVDSTSPSVAPEKLTAMTAAVAVIGETTNAGGGGMPCAPNAENFARFYAAAPSPALAMTITGADHMDWVDDPSCGFCGFCAAGAASPDLARMATRRLDVAWLRLQLEHDTTMEAWLTAPPELAAGTATVQRK